MHVIAAKAVAFQEALQPESQATPGAGCCEQQAAFGGVIGPGLPACLWAGYRQSYDVSGSHCKRVNGKRRRADPG